MDAGQWDERYAGSALVWSDGPNATVAELTQALPPGRALDLAAGEGRNALWLAERGWQVTAVDFSRVAVERMAGLAAARLGGDRDRLTPVRADLLSWEPAKTEYDLVLVVFLHLPAAGRRLVHRRAGAAVALGGTLLVLGHDRANLTDGVGGPTDPAVLLSPTEVMADLAGTGLDIDRARVLRRAVEVDGRRRHAIDCLVVARREGPAQQS